MFIKTCPIKTNQPMTVLGEVAHDPIKNDADSLAVGTVYKGSQIVRGAIAASGCKKSERLIAPRTVKRMLRNGQNFNVGETHFLYIWD